MTKKTQRNVFLPKTICYENIKYQQNGTMLRICLAASKNNGKNGHFLPDSSGKNWVDKRFIARHKNKCHNLTRK